MNSLQQPSAAPPPVPMDAAHEQVSQSEDVQLRLAHLFRHVGIADDDRFLLDLMTRYRSQAVPVCCMSVSLSGW